MPKNKSVDEMIQNLINKIDDLKWLMILIGNSDMDIVSSDNRCSAFNWIIRILETLVKDAWIFKQLFMKFQILPKL